MTRFERVQEILNAATEGRSPSHAGMGKFWNLPLDQLKALTIHGVKVIQTDGADRGARSGLVKALQGEAPFDDDGFGRMPLAGPFLPPEQIEFIRQWIDDGCPEDQFTPTGT